MHSDPDSTELLTPDTVAGTVAAGEPLPVGARLGHYRIEALLGRGGMGDVYRAQQLEPVSRIVALKLLRAQRLDTAHIAYFEVERQLLAQMRHPAIAQIFDAGTTPDGHPYFAMEFIEGSPITQYCDTHALSLQARIALFIRVCEGVQHAHQKGVIHRDLKPGNLLVDEVDGRRLPKVIDFGIATATNLGQGRDVAGTPDYMSPEQASGDQALVDTRSDVYALGVVLCELLTGQRPRANGETVTGNARTLRLPSEQLSTLSPADADALLAHRQQSLPHLQKVLRNELDFVVARAMRFDRSERYPSAAALAEDLQRFLRNYPLQAVPPSRGYAWRKFAQRHRTGMAAAALITAALVIGFAVSVYGLLQARAQRAIAEQRNAQLEKVAAFQQSMLEGIDIEAMGSGMAKGLREQIAQHTPDVAASFNANLANASTADVARSLIDQDILANAERAITREFADDPALAADLRESVAKVRLALGLPKQAAAGFAQVAKFRDGSFGASSPKALSARQQQASALLEAAAPKDAMVVLDAALHAASGLPANDPVLLRLRMNQAEAIATLGDRPRARKLFAALRAQAIRLRGERDPVTMDISNGLAILLGRMGEAEAGRAIMEALVPMRMQVLGKDAPDTLGALHNLAVMRIMTGDKQAAVRLQQQLVDTQTRRLGAEHPQTLAELGNLANMLNDSGKPEQALPIAQQVLAARTRVLGADHPQTLKAMLNLASILARVKRFDEAMAMQKQVADARTRLLGPNHPDTLFIQLNRAPTYFQAGQPKAALAQLDAFLPVARKVLGDKHPQVQMGYDIRAQAAADLGDKALAIASYRELLALREAALGAQDIKTIDAAWNLEGLLRKRGDLAASDELRTRYVTPLLQAQPSALDDDQKRMAKNIRDTEASEAQASVQKPVVR